MPMVKQKKYCDSCGMISKAIYNRVYAQDARKARRKHDAQKQSEIVIDIEILVSDAIFDTNLCDMDCARCKYADCILPEEI